MLVAAGTLALGASTAAAQAERCRVEGTIADVDVTVRSLFELERHHLDQPTLVVLDPIRGNEARVVELNSAEVDGRIHQPLAYFTTRALTMLGGDVALPSGLPVARLMRAVEGPWLFVDLELGDGVFLRHARIPCDALEVVARPSLGTSRGISQGDGRWSPRTDRLYLFEEAEARNGVRFEIAPDSPLRFRELELRDGWIHIEMQTSRGVTLRGWTHRSDVRYLRR